jgi:two-component system, cell cycle response regulator DivK
MPCILYVEDNEDNVYMLRRRLEQQGFEIVVAGDGAAALAMVREAAPDLILMDLSLPEIDGWEATRRLKADPATRAIPIIALSAHALAGDREKALGAGCDEFEPKPIDFASLRAKIAALLSTAP